MTNMYVDVNGVLHSVADVLSFMRYQDQNTYQSDVIWERYGLMALGVKWV